LCNAEARGIPTKKGIVELVDNRKTFEAVHAEA
jgi:hypothetical protein